MKRFGEKLRMLRTHRGMTLKHLATSLGYKAHGHISEIESGKKSPTTGFALAVARQFGVSVDDLLKDSMEVALPRQLQGGGKTAMGDPFADRSPSDTEVERFRLILSTYQDGTGMNASDHGRTLPGWRDFERSIALAFDGIPSGSKDIFDVRLPDREGFGVFYGISCKMRRELSRVDRDGRATIELSNSARRFWDRLASFGIDQSSYKRHPQEVGIALVDLVSEWHHDAGIEKGGNVDLSKSCYLTLSWNKEGWYQLHQFPLSLPEPAQLQWTFPTYTKGGKTVGNRLVGSDGLGTLFEWYGESGGQLKYYPLVADAAWESVRFQLEPLPSDREYGVLRKVEEYFPERWAAVVQSERSCE